MGSHLRAAMADSSNDPDDPEYRKRRETNNKSVAKNRARKKEEKEAKDRRMEELRKENQEIEQRTAVHQQELSFLRKVVTAHVQENGPGILEAEPVLKSFLEEEEKKDQNSG